MTLQFKKTDRIAELIQRKLAELIRRDIQDPRLPHFVTISEVKVSADLSYAKVYFTALTDDVKQTELILNTAAKHLRAALARTSKWRTVPELHFVYDESIEYGRKLSNLIDKVNPDDHDEADSETD